MDLVLGWGAHANAQTIDAHASLYGVLAHVISLQISCRTGYGGGTLSNELFIKSLYNSGQICA